MNSLFREDEIFEFKGEKYSYKDLKELRSKSKGTYYKEGEVTNIENGNFNDISELENFFNDAIIIDVSPKLIESNTLSPSEVKDINRKILTKEYKDFFDSVLEKMKNKTVTDEEVMKYWECKKLFKNVDYKYEINSFIKMNNNLASIEYFDKFSLLNCGRIIKLVRLVTGKDFKSNNVLITRDDIKDLLQLESSGALKQFLSSLEKHEIIYRKNKSSKTHIDFVVNPFLFNRVHNINLTTELYKMFPNSFEIFLGIDVCYYFKIVDKYQYIKFSIEDGMM